MDRLADFIRFQGIDMFKLGRRKKRFNERYSRIGSGQRIGNQDVEAEPFDEAQVAGEDGLDEALPTDAEGHDSETAPDLTDPLPIYDGGDQDGYGDPEAPALSSFDLAGESEITEIPENPVASENPQLPRVHANGHDYADGDQELPAWLDSYDPAKPPIKPPELPGAPAEAPDMAGEALPDPACSHTDDVLKPSKALESKDNIKPETKAAEPAPSWLDVADEVESRPPPMEYDADHALPQPDQDGFAESGSQQHEGPVDKASVAGPSADAKPAPPEALPEQTVAATKSVAAAPEDVALEDLRNDVPPGDVAIQRPAADAIPEMAQSPAPPDPVDNTHDRDSEALAEARPEAPAMRLPVKPVAPPLPLPLP